MKLQLITVLGAMLLFAGCHRDTRPAWQQAQAEQYLQIPEGLDSPGRSAELSVPATASSVEGSIHDDTTPPARITMDSDDAVGAAWQKVSARLLVAHIGTVLSRDDEAHHLGLSVQGSDLKQPKRGFFSRMLHHAPDPSRRFYATVSVVSENGQTKVQINGDGPAVSRVHEILEGQEG